MKTYKVTDSAHLLRLVRDRRSVTYHGRRMPAAAIVNWQFRIVAQLIEEGALHVYTPTARRPVNWNLKDAVP